MSFSPSLTGAAAGTAEPAAWTTVSASRGLQRRRGLLRGEGAGSGRGAFRRRAKAAEEANAPASTTGGFACTENECKRLGDEFALRRHLHGQPYLDPKSMQNNRIL